MNKVKIIHCGDIHLDTPLKDFNKKISDEIRNDIKIVLKNIVNKCNVEKIDVLLVAGDVFDNYSVEKETLKFISEIFGQLEDTRVFISPGNHDPINEKSFYNLVKWPENVYIFKGEMERVDINELKVSIHGYGFNEKYVYESLFENIEIKDEYINILVGHGDLENRGSEYNPILKKEIEESRLDYVALGHIHSFSGIQRSGETYYSYSGCPQGRGFDELGDKGVIKGEVYKGYVELEFIETSIKKYYEICVDIDGIEENFKIKDKILEETKELEKDRVLVKVILKGNRSVASNINTEWLTELLEDEYYFIKIVDKTKIRLDKLEESDDSIKGLFIKEINKKSELGEIDEDVLNLALEFGLKSLEGEEVSLYED